MADALVGSQTPRILATPVADGGPPDLNLGDKAIELGKKAGIVLDEWQQDNVVRALAVRPDGKWAAETVARVIPRQNGKNGELEVIQLAKLFLVRERLQIHTAHLTDTAAEAFNRLAERITNTPILDKRLQGIHRANGKEGITLRDGCRIRFKTRTAGGGRGLSGDTVYGDEAYNFPESTLGALRPTMSARPNPQMYLSSSAVDQQSPGHEHGIVLARVRELALRCAGDTAAAAAARLDYAEWSADEAAIAANPELIDDPRQWASANPAYRIRIFDDAIRAERASMAERTFLVERLGIGDWPSTAGDASVIPNEHLTACRDAESQIAGKLVFSADTFRGWTSVGVAGWRADGLPHIEVIDRAEGTEWLPARLKELQDRHGGAPVAIDLGPRAPIAGLAPDLVRLGVKIREVTATDVATACSGLVGAFENGQVRHLGQTEFRSAVRAASIRPLGDAFAWQRKSSSADITPLVAVTNAFGVLRADHRAASWLDHNDLLVLD